MLYTSIALTAMVAIARAQTPTGSCAPLHVIAAGGGNSDNETSYGLLVTLATNITSKIPGSDMVSLPYDKVDVPQASATDLPKLSPGAIPGGEANLKNYVTQYHSACPKSKIALVGYSSGAVINTLSMCTTGGLDQSLADSTIIGSVAYGDPFFTVGQPFNQGTCQMSGLDASSINLATCGAFTAGMHSYCDTNDPQCCSGPADDYEVHFVYPNEYDSVASDWIVSRYKMLGGSNSTSSSSSSSSTSSSTSTSSSSSTATTSSDPVTTSTAVIGTDPTPSTGVSSTVPTTTNGTFSNTATPTPSSTITPADPNGSWSVSPSYFLVGSMFIGAMHLFFI